MHKFRFKMNQNDANSVSSQGSLFPGSKGKLLSCASVAICSVASFQDYKHLLRHAK